MPSSRLILLRHATAAGAGDAGDASRPLTRRGTLEAARVGQRLANEDFRIGEVLCSTAQRCRETWAQIEDAFASSPTSMPASVSFDPQLYNAPESNLLYALAGVVPAETAPDVLLIAHNPGISYLAHSLGGHHPDDERRLRAGFAPAMTAVFEVNGPWSALGSDRATLLSFLEP